MLAGVAVAAAGGKALPVSVAELCKKVKAGDGHAAIAKSLADADDALILLGNIAGRHGAYSAVRALAAAIAELTGAKLGNVSEGANSAGAQLAGVLPHRVQGGTARAGAGLDAAAMLNESLDVVVLLNIEPDADIHASTDAVAKLSKQDFVVALTPYVSDALLAAADLLLPIGTFAETSGTYVNVAGTWQSFGGVASPVGQARPAWKVLRVIGNLVDAASFDYETSEDVRDELMAQLGDVAPDNQYAGSGKIAIPNGEDEPAAEIDTPLYSVDNMVRRANALQLTPEARRAAEAGD
jgi:NADH-quinone oxidoreductase subunit G